MSRYLTKLADQILVFVSPEHAQSIKWKDGIGEPGSITNELDEDSDNDDEDSDDNDEDSDDDEENMSSDDERVYDFSVEKTAEQEESVKMRVGFEARQHA